MSGFTESILERKLSELNASAQSIQQLSLWLVHHRKHYQVIVRVWYATLFKIASANRKLAFLYLANDVVQNAKKKHPEYSKEFGGVMKKVMEHMALLDIDMKTVKSIGRLLAVWQERNIFESKVQVEMNRIWATKQIEVKSEEAAAATDSSTEPSPKKSKKDTTPNKLKRKLSSSGGEDGNTSDTNSADKSANDVLQAILSPSDSPTSAAAQNSDPPDTEHLIKALQDLENAASSDAGIREKIAKLPSEVSEESKLDNLKSPEAGRDLMVKVDQATKLLNQYNERLQQELKERQKVNKMITDFLAAQRDLETQAEERLEQYRDKLEKVNSIRDELKSHIQSLPDLTKLPDVTGGLAPLPSAGDLFTK